MRIPGAAGPASPRMLGEVGDKQVRGKVRARGTSQGQGKLMSSQFLTSPGGFFYCSQVPRSNAHDPPRNFWKKYSIILPEGSTHPMTLMDSYVKVILKGCEHHPCTKIAFFRPPPTFKMSCGSQTLS